MNRRNFLKKIGSVCITIVTIPIAIVLIKKEVKDKQVSLIDHDTWKRNWQKQPYGIPHWMEEID